MLDSSEYNVLRGQFDYYLKMFETSIGVNGEGDEELADNLDFREGFNDLFDTIGMILNKYCDDLMKDNWYEQQGKELIFGKLVGDE